MLLNEKIYLSYNYGKLSIVYNWNGEQMQETNQVKTTTIQILMNGIIIWIIYLKLFYSLKKINYYTFRKDENLK